MLYGGFSTTSTPRFGDVWEWNGTAWTQLSAASLGTPAPNPRAGHAMCYDRSRGVSVIIAGDDVRPVAPFPSNGGDDEVWQLGGAAPRIDTSPINRSRPAGSDIFMSVAVVSSNAVTYQWRKNGVAMANNARISGATTSLLTIRNLNATDAGNYDCLVTSTCGSSISAASRLTIGCAADYDDGSGTGNPDGGVTIEDMLYYTLLWRNGNVAADLDDGSGTGSADSGVGIEDLLFYLNRFNAGC
jgi:hypothetical protein